MVVVVVSDAELARRIADGDRGAEKELCARFAPRIRLYGLKHLRDDDRARDLVQAVLIVVLEAARARKIEDVERIDRFILGTCRNLAHRTREADAKAPPSEAVVAVELDSLVLDIPALYRCMGKLDLRARTILHLAFYRDKPAAEIATVLDTTPGNVRVLRHRAMTELRECMGAGAS